MDDPTTSPGKMKGHFRQDSMVSCRWPANRTRSGPYSSRRWGDESGVKRWH